MARYPPTPPHHAPLCYVWSQNFQQSRRYGKTLFFRVSACTVTLTLRMGTGVLCVTSQVMMTHQHTKFSTRKVNISGSKDIVRTSNIFPEDLNQPCDLDVEHSNPKLSHITLWHMIMHHTIPSFRLQKVQSTSAGYCLRIQAQTVTKLKKWTQTCSMTLQVMMMHQHTMFH